MRWSSSVSVWGQFITDGSPMALWMYNSEQQPVHRFSICRSSVRHLPERSWTVVAFPCFTVVKTFTSWYALLLLFFLSKEVGNVNVGESFGVKLTETLLSPLNGCLSSKELRLLYSFALKQNIYKEEENAAVTYSSAYSMITLLFQTCSVTKRASYFDMGLLSAIFSQTVRCQ